MPVASSPRRPIEPYGRDASHYLLDIARGAGEIGRSPSAPVRGVRGCGRDDAGGGREVEMVQRWLVAALLAAMTASVCGCGWFEKKESGEAAGATGTAARPAPAHLPQVNPPISDIPVPIGFKLDESKSRNYAVAGVRFVDHVYSGSGDKFELKRFYERYMVMNRWVPSTSLFAQGRLELDFEKGGERSRITIVEGGWLEATRVSVLVWPDKPAGKGQSLQG
jgi:hypothetical protein